MDFEVAFLSKDLTTFLVGGLVDIATHKLTKPIRVTLGELDGWTILLVGVIFRVHLNHLVMWMLSHFFQ